MTTGMQLAAARAGEKDSRPRKAKARRVLAFAFALFNGVRVVTYLPTVWAIHASGDSGQHSLITWLTWLGANGTMAAWLYEKDGGVNKAVLVSIGNAAMCLLTSAVIAWYRF